MIRARTAGFRRHVFLAPLILAALAFLLGAAQADASHRCGHKRTCTAPADTSPPETTITSGPSGTISADSASFGFSSSESSSTFECRLDASNWAACSSPKSYSGLTDGSHTFNVRAKDAAGNIDASPASRTVTVEVAPAYSVSASPTSVSSRQSITASWKVTSDTSTTDWVGIFKQSDASDGNTLGEWYYTDGAKTGSKTFTAPASAGTYEIRYFRNDRWEVSARSGPITVTTAEQPTGAKATTAAVDPTGAYILSDAEATKRVRRSTWEPRPQNSVARRSIPEAHGGGSQTVGANQKIPTQAELDYFRLHFPAGNPNLNKITGNHGLGNNATTDEIIQWAAHKWQVDEDLIRAQMVLESNWDNAGTGDYDDGVHAESFGLPQVRRNVHRTAPDYNGTFPLARNSTSFALDYFGSAMRYYYDGHAEGWVTQPRPGTGDIWATVGRWYCGGCNIEATAQWYIDGVKERLANRTWEQAGF